MKFIVCGDALFSSRNLAARLDGKLVSLLKSADGGFVNAEFCTPNRNTPPACGRGYTTSVRPPLLDEFSDLNLKMVCFANNHSGDYGWQGVIDTLEAAESRGLTPCGTARSLKEARLPKFLDTKTGRVGIVTASSTRSEVFAASDGGAGVVPRPGVNPLRWGRSYVLPEKLFNELANIDRALGTRESMDEGCKIETFAPGNAQSFKFGSLFEGCLQIELGDKAYVRTYVNQEDEAEILKSIVDAKKRSDLTLFNLHTHEGKNENWYSHQVPEFIENIARKAVEAGADAVFCHGAHFLRGVEIFKGKPIFYNLGSLLMEFEAGESIITPEMYLSYGYSQDSRPSDLHTRRAKDRNGNFIGFNSQRRFSENCLLELDYDFDKGCTWRLLPLDLHLDAPRPLSRGIPEIADDKVASLIADHLTDYSKKYGTKLVYDKNIKRIVLA